MLILRKAEKAKTKMRLGLAGVSGSGKTYSALLLASGITDWAKICVIDTENGSADLYSHLGEYNVIALQAPFTPERYIEAVTSAEAAGMEVIIIDSVTHEWDGKGGCLEMNQALADAKFKGNTWAAWSQTTPRHQRFLQAILQSKAHIITTVRTKTDTVQTDDKKIKKVGLKEIQREGYEYELTANFTIDRDTHLAIASKDRTGLFSEVDPFRVTVETGAKIKQWAESGVEAVTPTVEVAKAMLISPLNAKLLEATAKLKGKDLAGALEHFGVPTVQFLTSVQAEALMVKLNKMPNIDDPFAQKKENSKEVPKITS